MPTRCAMKTRRNKKTDLCSLKSKIFSRKIKQHLPMTQVNLDDYCISPNQFAEYYAKSNIFTKLLNIFTKPRKCVSGSVVCPIRGIHEEYIRNTDEIYILSNEKAYKFQNDDTLYWVIHIKNEFAVIRKENENDLLIMSNSNVPYIRGLLEGMAL